MDGVFMKKLLGLLLVLSLCAGIFYLRQLLTDRQMLEQELVRLHVVAASDSDHDQSVKLSVRDAVLEYLEPLLEDITDPQQAKDYIQDHLPQIQSIADSALHRLGEASRATVSFMKEEFPLREYDSFTLPSGIYDSLRIVIGQGEGHNWWCVVFPKMCYSTVQVKDVTAGAGFSEELTGAITGEYKLRFYFLDVLGRTQNFFHRG